MKEGEIFLVSLPEDERTGTEIKKDRPCIIIKNFIGYGLVFPVAISRGEKRFLEPLNVPLIRTAENGLIEDSVAVTYQAFSVSKDRLIKRLGELDKESFDIVKETLRRRLNL
ncbi:MAG: hypothetical protein BJBARM5_0900 [Candidatus Parvarchaeum acidophilus ARMAN-5]|uniref:Transcriptional modulator of MazE/toxin, MazF n=1 Tax=Candidatus Parvarchaeum acidophilus ARMAN-5 TaxID=662762 RepID=D6GWN0_PARA5|nr:MAG: hypothetical protein BJBARM5_0900 [Candidatus Parvarchaeum acidophilus ARMAN-5]